MLWLFKSISCLNCTRVEVIHRCTWRCSESILAWWWCLVCLHQVCWCSRKWERGWEERAGQVRAYFHWVCLCCVLSSWLVLFVLCTSCTRHVFCTVTLTSAQTYSHSSQTRLTSMGWVCAECVFSGQFWNVGEQNPKILTAVRECLLLSRWCSEDFCGFFFWDYLSAVAENYTLRVVGVKHQNTEMKLALTLRRSSHTDLHRVYYRPVSYGVYLHISLSGGN